MTNQDVPLWKFLEDEGLVPPAPPSPLAGLRERLEKSDLIATIGQIAHAINSRAGNLMVEVQSYLPPEPLVYSTTFRKGRRDYVMQIELWDTRPTLVFLTRTLRGDAPARWLGPLYRFVAKDEYAFDIHYSSMFDPEDVSAREIERWFVYLLSGLDRGLAPSSVGTPSLSVSISTAQRQFTSLRGTETD